MDTISGVVHTLCIAAMASAVAEVLLAGRRGSDIVSMMLSLAGISSILTACAQFLNKTD